MKRRYVTLAEVRASVREHTPDPPDGLTVTWLKRPYPVTYPTGVRGYAARVRLEAPGFRAHDYLLMGDDTGWRMA